MFDASVLRGGEAEEIRASGDFVAGVRGHASDVGRAIVTNADQTIVAAVEGEIYNAGEGGTGAIPALYEKYGADFPKNINGIFGIALFDARRKRLHLVRDHLGSHSLFYSSRGDQVLFGTTIHAILGSGLVSRELSTRGMNAYFGSTNIPAPDTMFQDILCVRPGSMAIYEAGRWSEHDYWRSQDLEEDFGRSEQDWVEEVRAMLRDSILIRARLDGACGSLVSGGVDTAIIAATLCGLRGAAEAELPVFSIAFSEKQYSDADLQSIMYRKYPLKPHSKLLTPNEFAETLQNAVRYLDKPVNDTAFAGMYHAFHLAQLAGCSTVFDGEGADELFYTIHGLGEWEFQRYLRVPFWLRRAVFHTLIPHYPVGTTYWTRAWRRLYKIGLTDEERTLSRLPCYYNHATPILDLREAGTLPDPYEAGKKYLKDSALKDPVNRYFYAITKTYLADGLLFKNERMASANGITNRTPFIDYRLTELAFRIPLAHKLAKPTASDDGTKQVYKKAVRGLIPDEILERKKKRGFSQPSGIWYRGELKGFVEDVLFSPNSLCLPYLNRAYMRRLWTKHVSGEHNLDYFINSLLIFELWLRAFRP
jgi:asparagine synthase (glutamine-hydrolysing)